MRLQQTFFVGALLSAFLVSPLSGTRAAGADDGAAPSVGAAPGVIALWSQGQPAFGLYVTQSSPGEEDASPHPATFSVETGRELAQNPLLDFAFLSLEQHYDAASARNVAQGLADADAAPDLLVRIPPISTDGPDAARERVREVLALGADGVVIPHVMSLEEARTALSFFEGVDVWSPQNRDGTVVALLIVEDPQVFDELQAIADLPGYSGLLCGIGSLTAALGGDREAAEAIALEVLETSTRAGLVDLMTVDPASVARRVEQGFLALLAYGPQALEAIRIGRAAAGRAIVREES